MTPYVDDSDFTLYVGDALTVLQTLPDESVDCVVTSPPYWGLRDYGTGEWAGGNPDCDHKGPPMRTNAKPYDGSAAFHGGHQRANEFFANTCGKCGAQRVDQQLGLEPTPDQYVTRMVEVFREVRRVLAKHGTCWVNLGDSYTSGGRDGHGTRVGYKQQTNRGMNGENDPVRAPQVVGLKPKDLVGIPWRVAFALQADGWYLRSDIIWSKPNPMPESVTDRPTKAHEYVFLLSKQPRYWFDQEAVREPHSRDWSGQAGLIGDGKSRWAEQAGRNDYNGRAAPPQLNPAGRNIRSVWEIATQPYPEAHFATFPEELARRCILAGCAAEVCRQCRKPRERIVESRSLSRPDLPRDHPEWRPSRYDSGKAGDPQSPGPGQRFSEVTTVGWSDCGCRVCPTTTGCDCDGECVKTDYRPGVVLDPFLGSGTTALVARNHGRHAVGIELNPVYAELAAKRTRQLSLLAETSA